MPLCSELSNSQKQAIISLIEKRKDKRLIKNCCPVSLINVDAKIAWKALAKHLEKTLPENIIHFNHNVFIKRGAIFNAMRTIEDVLEYAKQKDLSRILLAVDFEKAFDTLNSTRRSPLRRGVRQGDPLSYLFVIALEVLAIRI